MFKSLATVPLKRALLATVTMYEWDVLQILLKISQIVKNPLSMETCRVPMN